MHIHKIANSLRKTFTKNSYFLFTVLLFVASLLTLWVATVVARERTHVPYAGVSILQPLTSGSSTVTVTKVERKPGAQPFSAPDGYEYLVVSLRIRNNGEKPFTILPTNDTYVKDTDGAVSYLTPYTLEKPFHSGIILPGDSTEGELSYLVPKKASYRFYVESDWSSTAIPFNVMNADAKGVK